MIVSSQPSRASLFKGSSTALCSVAAVTRWRPRFFKPGTAPLSARLLASVPPLVKMTRPGWRPSRSAPKMRPSELFRRNCWISFEPVEGSIGALADYIGPHKILWATDYPHRDGFFPGAPQMLKERLKGLSPETQREIMAGGAKQFYGLH